ncbi:MAG: ribonuclease P protein component [Patescibacteria group bacterium]
MKDLCRLRSSKDIERVVRHGRKKDSVFFRLASAPNDCGCLCLALVVPRAADKRATVRNRLRRRAREWVQREQNLLRTPADAVLVFKKQAASAPRKEFYKELALIFRALAR